MRVSDDDRRRRLVLPRARADARTSVQVRHRRTVRTPGPSRISHAVRPVRTRSASSSAVVAGASAESSTSASRHTSPGTSWARTRTAPVSASGPGRHDLSSAPPALPEVRHRVRSGEPPEEWARSTSDASRRDGQRLGDPFGRASGVRRVDAQHAARQQSVGRTSIGRTSIGTDSLRSGREVGASDAAQAPSDPPCTEHWSEDRARWVRRRKLLPQRELERLPPRDVDAVRPAPDLSAGGALSSRRSSG